MKEKKDNDIRYFQVRLPKESWVFLKNKSAELEVSMASIIIDCIEKYKKKIENKLIKKNIDV